MAVPRGKLWLSAWMQSVKAQIEHRKEIIIIKKGWYCGLQHQPLIFEIIKKAVGI